MTEIKDSTLRSMVNRKGYALKKRRSNSLDNRGVYMIVDGNNYIVAGEHFEMSPEDVQIFLKS